MQTKTIKVETPNSAPYDIILGSGVLGELGAAVRKVGALAGVSRAFIISDSNVAPLYLSHVIESLRDAGYKTNDYTIPAGEASKNTSTLNDIWEIMARIGTGRDAFIVALGGGVVGDAAGFAAATYMRGIQYIQVPTSMLAMVDSSVGGKTAVNLSAGKNLVGCFKQPALVYADIQTLSTLNEREWKCGLGEVAKSALVGGGEFFSWMVENAASLNSRESSEILTSAIERCVNFKARVVEQDEFERTGMRECLNYGHTLAHAIETLSGYGTYSHGVAVAEGMRFAAALNTELAATAAGDVAGTDATSACEVATATGDVAGTDATSACKAATARSSTAADDASVQAAQSFASAQSELLDALGLSALQWGCEPKRVLACMKRDKKTRGGRVRFVLLDSTGCWQVKEVEDSAILKALENWMQLKN